MMMMMTSSSTTAASASCAARPGGARVARRLSPLSFHHDAVGQRSGSGLMKTSSSGGRFGRRRGDARDRASLAVRADATPARGYVTAVVSGRKRRVLKPLKNSPPASYDPKLDDDELFGGDCPSDGACSIEGASVDANKAPERRGSRSDAASTDEAHERQREQLAALGRATNAPELRRKRRVLKPLRREPDAQPAMPAHVYVEEGNCPSDGCSIENAAAPTWDIETLKKRGYNSARHDSDEARERVSFQMEALRQQRAEDARRLAEARASADAAIDADAEMTEEEAAKAKAQKEAFYFSIGLFAVSAYGLLGHDVGSAQAAVSSAAGIDPFFNFNPVCPASDGVFRVGQKAALALAGDQNIENYRPLINDVLIRVRTELCVLESFGRETALPFIREKGLGWVLPLKETSETYLAGVVFMVGTNFILLGSTKVVAILAIYHDLSLGLLARGAGSLLGMANGEADLERRERQFNELMDAQMAEVKALMMDASLSRQERERKTAEVNARYSTEMENVKETLDVRTAEDSTSVLGKLRRGAGAAAVPLRVYGKGSSMLRNGLEVFDTFCSRYFVAFTVTYIIIKTTHYVFFPDLFA